MTVPEVKWITSSTETKDSHWEVQVHSHLSITSAVRYFRIKVERSKSYKSYHTYTHTHTCTHTHIIVEKEVRSIPCLICINIGQMLDYILLK